MDLNGYTVTMQLRIQEMDASACIHRLYALEGAIFGVPKIELPLDQKTYPKDFYNAHKL